jgi:hypothetical protein
MFPFAVVLTGFLSTLTLAEPNPAKEPAVAAINKLGGRVTLDEEKPGKPVIGVDLTATKITDCGLVHLKGLTKLRLLFLTKTKITDSGLVHLKGLIGRRSLYLVRTNVTAAGVKKLRAALPKCKIYWVRRVF